MSIDVRDRLSGIHAATVVPMLSDLSVDEDSLFQHIAKVSHTPGIRGLLVNGHAGENFVLSPAEKRRVVEIARNAAPDGCLICCGVNSESSLELAREAAVAEEAGADVILVFPPNSFALGVDSASVVLHHRYALDATTVPLLIYGAPIGAGRMAYDEATLAALAAEPRIVGIKEGSWEVAHYEANLRFLKSRRADFVVMGSGDEHLMTSYLIGSAGSQVSLAAVIPRLVVSLWECCEANDWEAARKAHERIYALAVAVYRAPPAGRATARLKGCLKLLGDIDLPLVRPPQRQAAGEELARLAAALELAHV